MVVPLPALAHDVREDFRRTIGQFDPGHALACLPVPLILTSYAITCMMGASQAAEVSRYLGGDLVYSIAVDSHVTDSLTASTRC